MAESRRRGAPRLVPMSRGQCVPPESGVDYAHVLDLPPDGMARGLIGVAGAMLGYAVVVPLLTQLFIALGWLVTGMPGTWQQHSARALRYETVDGLIATHLGLAGLIPIVVLLAKFVHHRRATWIWSVQPGFRWRFALLVALVAGVVINVTQVIVKGGGSWGFTAPSDWWVWLIAILLTSPLQAAAEEVLFRGYFMNCLGSMGANRWVAVVVSALVFALAHGTQNMWLFADRFTFGLLAGALVILTGGLEAGIAAHVLNNLFAFGYSVFRGGASVARGLTSMGWVDALWDVTGFLAIALAAWWISRWMTVATRTPDDLVMAELEHSGKA